MADDSKILIDNEELNQDTDGPELTSFKEYDLDEVDALSNPITAPIKVVNARSTNGNDSNLLYKLVFGLSAVVSVVSTGIIGWMGHAVFVSTSEAPGSARDSEFSLESFTLAAAVAGEVGGAAGMAWSGKKLCEGCCASNNTQPSNDIEMRDRTTTEIRKSSAKDLAGQDASTTEGKSTAINIE